ncbi:MAG: hypothetical protein ABR907_06240 [Terracidiphilus sp.]
MSIPRIILAALAAFVAYMGVGALAFGLIPALRTEFLKYPAVYRDQSGQMSHMPIGMAGILVSILSLAVLYGLIYQGGSGLMEGARFGAIIGVFAIGAFTLHDYVNLNIGFKLTLQQSLAYFLEWFIVGVVIGLIYRPAISH